MPATGMKPFAAEATNEASWGWRLSMKTNDRSCTMGLPLSLCPRVPSDAADMVAMAVSKDRAPRRARTMSRAKDRRTANASQPEICDGLFYTILDVSREDTENA